MRIIRGSVFIVLGAIATASGATAQVRLYAGVGLDGRSGPLYSVDPTTAVSTPIGPGLGFGAQGLAEHPTTGVLYGVRHSSLGLSGLYTVNTTTGIGSPLIPGCCSGAYDISFRSDGTLFAWSNPLHDLVTFNLATGAQTIIGDSGLTGAAGGGLAFDASGTLYLATAPRGPLYTVNSATGLATRVATLSAGPRQGLIVALAVHPGTGVLYGVDLVVGSSGGPASLITIDVTTGQITHIGALPNGVDALAFSGSFAVPTMPEGLFLMFAFVLVMSAVFMPRKNGRLA